MRMSIGYLEPLVLKVQRVSGDMLLFAENKSSSFREFDFGVLNRATFAFHNDFTLHKAFT